MKILPIGKADPKKFADFIGTYELAPGQTRSVTGEGDKLFVERNGKKEQLLPETSELFFRKGVEGRILFRYAPTVKSTRLSTVVTTKTSFGEKRNSSPSLRFVSWLPD